MANEEMQLGRRLQWRGGGGGDFPHHYNGGEFTTKPAPNFAQNENDLNFIAGNSKPWGKSH